MTETMRVTIMGAGGMGALFGAILTDGGLDVALVDRDDEHIDAINRDGLAASPASAASASVDSSPPPTPAGSRAPTSFCFNARPRARGARRRRRNI